MVHSYYRKGEDPEVDLEAVAVAKDGVVIVVMLEVADLMLTTVMVATKAVLQRP